MGGALETCGCFRLLRLRLSRMSSREDRKSERVFTSISIFYSHRPQVKTGILHGGSPVVMETASSETRTAASPFTPRLKSTKLELKLISLLITRVQNEEEHSGAPSRLRDGVWDEGPIGGRLDRLSNVGTTRTSRPSTSGRFREKRAMLQATRLAPGRRRLNGRK